MSLIAGTRLGPYEILAVIGAGGMGEVYRGRDTKLNRDVAIKVLPDLFAADLDRLRRFEREAQTLAALNHPNIAQVFGVLEAPAALVMEFVDGEDLSQWLARGPIQMEEGLLLAKQIAGALEAAHDQGIVHRDLKPANIKIRPDGIVKVLDFGLAKAVAQGLSGVGQGFSPADTGSPEGLRYGLENSPTCASPGMTEMGMILGTAAYMSPEQARGKPVDRRADIWAFGCVLYEMIAGRQTFRGDTVTDVLAAVVRQDPDWSTLPADTPPSVRRLLHRCLQKDPSKRLRDIGDARLDLEDSDLHESPPPLAPPRSAWRGRLPWAVAVVALAAAAWMWTVWRQGTGTSGSAQGQVTYLDVSFPPDIEPVPTLESGFNVSPDGRLVVVTGVRGGARRLHVRRLSSESSVEIGDSAGVTGSAFSPDSGSIAFLGNSGLVITVSLADQQRATLARGADLAGGIAWGTPGVVFARNGALWLAPTDGGKERQLTRLDAARKEVLHANPLVLPDGRTVLFSSLTTETGTERIEAVSVDGGARTIALERASTPVWAPTGHLLFARDGGVLATAFDTTALKATGVATSVIPKGRVAPTASGGLGIRLSESGDLLLLPSDYQTKRVESVARDGSTVGLAFPSARYLNPRVSPDGRRVMVEVAALRLEALDLERQTLSRLTPETAGINFTIWNSDGRHIIYRRYNSPYWLSADGSGTQGSVPSGVSNDYPSGAGPDPDTFFATRIGPNTAGDIVLMSRTGRHEPKNLIATPFYEGGAQLSPDGRWLVYVSTESGQSEIQVRRYPSLERKWQISAGFGVQPRWRADGGEIFFRDGQSMVGVPFGGSQDEPVIGKPVALFRDEFDLGQGITIANYDVTREGRFLMLRRDTKGIGLRIVLNWTEELKRIIQDGGVR